MSRFRSIQRACHGDARDLGFQADDSVALVLTSPPYPMIAMWDEIFTELDPAAGEALAAEDGAAAFEKMHVVLDEVWAECHRVLQSGGLLVVNIGDATRRLGTRFRLWSNHARILVACERLGFDVLPDILWRKPNNSPTKFMGSGMLPPGAHVTYEHEYLLVLRKGSGRKFARGEESSERRASAYFWEERNRWFSDVWSDLPGVSQTGDLGRARKRSAAFPAELAWRLVQMFSVRGDRVLDPFGGVGTTLHATLATGRDGILVERDPALFPVIEAALAGAQTWGAERATRRLRDHRAFVAEREALGKPLGHANGPHQFPVMTAQESDLEVLTPAAVKGSSISSGLSIEYERAADLREVGLFDGVSASGKATAETSSEAGSGSDRAAKCSGSRGAGSAGEASGAEG